MLDGKQEAHVHGEHSEHRHHHRRSLRHRALHALKSLSSHKRVLIPAVAAIIVVVLLTVFAMRLSYQENKSLQVRSSTNRSANAGYLRIAYKGKTYRYNPRITTILYGGLDSKGEMRTRSIYRFAPQADSISLIVLDEYHHVMTIIAINRNTITPIHKFTLYGHDRGAFTDQLCLSFSYGDGGEASSKNLCRAVSDLLHGIPIQDYVISNRTSIPEITRIIGDVKVTVPNDDLEKYGFIKGETAVIGSDNIERFLRSRDVNIAYSNAGRMERQKAYINGAVDKIMNLFKKSATSVWNKLEALEYCMQTNITRNRYIDLTNTLSNMAYGEQNYYTPEGEYRSGALYDEFYVDDEKLLDKIVEIFYIED